jgi:hypothetical protein
MKFEKALYQKSYLWFIAFFLFMLWGFWFTYFTRIADQENYRMHLHGVALILWCLMLIIQPLLIRSKKVELHKVSGKLSYFIVPLLLYSTTDLLLYRLHGKEVLTDSDNFFVAMVMNALLVFVILYTLAIFHRRKGTLHARYMLSTVFPILTPITDRIISIHFPGMLNGLPEIDGIPIVPIYGFALADVLLILLCIWDWLAHRRWNVFPLVLLLLSAYHFSVLNFYKYPFWVDFCKWFVGIR